MSTEITKLVIDRSRWLRGEGGGESALLRQADKKMCCLGFFGLACGVPSESMLDKGEPAAVEMDAKSLWPPWLEGSVHRLIETNDAENLTDGEREMGIAAEFAAHGVEVEFIDGDPVAPLVPEKPSPTDAPHIGQRFDSVPK